MEVCPIVDADATPAKFIGNPLSSPMLDQIFTAKSLQYKPVRFEIGEIARRKTGKPEKYDFDNMVFITYSAMTREQRRQCEHQLCLMLNDTNIWIADMKNKQTALDQGFKESPTGYLAASGQTYEQYIEACLHRLKRDKRYIKKARIQFFLAKCGVKRKSMIFPICTTFLKDLPETIPHFAAQPKQPTPEPAAAQDDQTMDIKIKLRAERKRQRKNNPAFQRAAAEILAQDD